MADPRCPAEGTGRDSSRKRIFAPRSSAPRAPSPSCGGWSWGRCFSSRAVVLLVAAFLGVTMYRYAHPPAAASQETPDRLFLAYKDVSFPSADGVPLSGWWIEGTGGLPVLVLCHDLGESRASLLGLAARLAEQKYPILLFDFRGHGASGGASSFGVLEKRDLLGAIDWVSSQPKVDAGRIGVVGVGMGAYAAILAASERPQIRSLVLDSPYPDAPGEFLAAGMPPGMMRGWVASWSEFVYDVWYRVRAKDESAGRRVRDLSERNLLFLAPGGVERSASDARAMYDSVSETRHNFKNLQLLKATRTTALYGEDREKYDQEVIRFFASYLPPVPRGELPAGGSVVSPPAH